MRNRINSLCVIGLVFAVSAPVLAEDYKLKQCVVSLLAEAQVPSRKAGVIQSYLVEEGSLVKAGDDLVQIDDAEARVQLTASQRQLEAAHQRAANDIDVRYAKAAADVARAEVTTAEDANANVPRSVQDSEVRRLRLDQNRAVLGIEQAEAEFALAAIDTDVAQANVDAAKLEVATRRVKSPIDGIVVRLHRREGEWTEVGEPICHVVGLKEMRVTGFVNVKEHEQSAVIGRPATVTVRLGNRLEDFEGQIGFASPIVQPGGEYRVWVKLENRRIGDSWILRPGILVEMSIDVID